MPLEEGPSLARTRTVPRLMTSRLRDDSQRTVAHPSPDDRDGSQTTQTISRSHMLEQQLKNEDKETIGTLSRAIKGARLRKWEISQECFNLVCRALQIPCDDGCNGSFQGKKFILVLYIKTDPFTNLTPCVHQHASTVTLGGQDTSINPGRQEHPACWDVEGSSQGGAAIRNVSSPRTSHHQPIV